MYFTWDNFEYKCRMQKIPAFATPASLKKRKFYLPFLSRILQISLVYTPPALPNPFRDPPSILFDIYSEHFRIPNHRHHSIFTWVILLHGGEGSLTSAPSDIGWSQVNGPLLWLCANIGLLGSFGVLTYAERSIGVFFPEILNSSSYF